MAHEYVVVEKVQDYREQMYDRAVVYMDYEDRIWELINENPIDKKYIMGPNVTTEGRIENAVNYRDSWRAEIDYALQVLQTVMDAEQYNQLVISYEGWKVYMESLHSVEMDYYYNGGIIGGLEYPHVIEVEATRTKDFAVSLLSLEYALTRKIDYVFDN